MSALKQKLGRITASAGVFACATAAILAVGGAGASSASAACTTPGLKGAGSSLQRVAQTEIFEPAWGNSGCGTGSNAKVAYTATSSSDGLGKFGYLGSGVVATENAVIGTDDAPTSSQITTARAAAHNADAVIVPVTQTAIAVVANPPSGCTLTQITNANLEAAFSGKATKWSEIGGSGSTCATSNITRVVRAEGSGTTYQFKNYLARIRGLGTTGETAPCTGQPKWSSLEPIENATTGAPNTTWPECGTIAVTTAAKGSGVVAKVVATAGSIGYASLPDAKANASSVQLKVQDGVVSEKPVYASPASGEEANCKSAVYPVPSSTTGLDVDWSQSFGGNPTISGGVYPICTLTYDLGWHSYATANSAFGTSVGAQVKAYYKFILSNKLGTTPKYYANLPSNVQSAAELAANAIN